MHKIEQISKTIIQDIHHFYCDDCGKHLGSSQEYDDGWYEELGEFELKMRLPQGCYILKKCLCDECKEKYPVKLQSILEDIGFKKDSSWC